MNRTMTGMLAAVGVVGLAGASIAQPVIDGAGLTGEYGTPLYVNTANPTQFGDNTDPSVGFANGSEIDAIYAVIEEDFFGDLVLFIGVAGNLESNFNKLEVFIDTVEGSGQAKLRGDNPDIDFNGLNRQGDDGSGNGTRFDACFAADYYFTMTTGNYNPDTDEAEVYANFADVKPVSEGGVGFYLGQGFTGSDGSLAGGENPFNILATINNSNIAGVTDTTATGGELVDTGIEIAIPLFALGSPTSDLLISVSVNGGGHDFLSNQVGGGLPASFGNIGEPRNADYPSYSGTQHVTVANGAARGTCFALDVSDLVGGQNGILQATGGTANATTYFVYSLAGRGETDVPQLGVTLDLANPALLGTAQSNGQGTATFQQRVPGAASGRTVYTQAAQTGKTTNVVVRSVQ